MVEVTTDLWQRIERDLDWSLWQWERLPAVEAAIDQWDQLDQIHFVEEWPLEDERLRRLEQYVAAGALGPEQRVRYDKLIALVVRNRPIIQRLRAS